MFGLITLLRSPLFGALLAGGVALGGFLSWRHSIRTDAVKDIKIEQQTHQIEKLNNANSAQSRVRTHLRRHPDRVHEDDGYRRD